MAPQRASASAPLQIVFFSRKKAGLDIYRGPCMSITLVFH